jgi:hypothetical protein
MIQDSDISSQQATQFKSVRAFCIVTVLLLALSSILELLVSYKKMKYEDYPSIAAICAMIFEILALVIWNQGVQSSLCSTTATQNASVGVGYSFVLAIAGCCGSFMWLCVLRHYRIARLKESRAGTSTNHRIYTLQENKQAEQNVFDITNRSSNMLDVSTHQYSQSLQLAAPNSNSMATVTVHHNQTQVVVPVTVTAQYLQSRFGLLKEPIGLLLRNGSQVEIDLHDPAVNRNTLAGLETVLII